MYKFLVSIILVFAFISCDSSNIDEKKFIDTYREILIARETIADSALANIKVDSIISVNGYTSISFREVFFELAKDRKSFGNLIDSVRKSIVADSVAFR